ncbi:molybdopterin molybdenumtransferase MoeA [Novosphingobium umbonatum]|uniref:Molybdopterin molybdenumtransferase n=1 Tax=Novosphingobium umbonatum TaxID=1908524 RepID=A0A437N1J6_9SPHN|nr:molybdopterin molybdotransferase MoeA [Novosphingobium umbonatum]RVU03797.1 molybdopterin molybdenumtransferase MoeA [Novosphingobium umbonatum]
MSKLLDLAEAQARLLAMAVPLPVEQVPIEAAMGRYLAQDLPALRQQPAVDLSAMDGYALSGEDTSGPWRLRGESAAGHPYQGVVQKGEACRISTGAVLPEGADWVLLQEDTRREGDRLHLTGTLPHPLPRHIRRAGFDFAQGQTLLRAGQRITPASLALAISGGHASLPMRQRPRIAILDSGDELAPIGAPTAAHQIPASNGAMLAAQLQPEAGRIDRLGPVSDRMDALLAALDAASEADVIITSGGASVGDHDLIRPALEQWGADLAFWRVALRPGKPLMVAQKGRQIIIGLPGNPVSSHVTAFLFVLPLLRALQGAEHPLPKPFYAPVASSLPAGGERCEFLRGAWDGAVIQPNPMRDSSALAALASANCLIERPIGADAVQAGGLVRAYLL